MGECKQEENNTHFEYEIRDAFSCLRNDCRLKLLLAQTIYIYIYTLRRIHKQTQLEFRANKQTIR